MPCAEWGLVSGGVPSSWEWSAVERGQATCSLSLGFLGRETALRCSPGAWAVR